MNKQKGLWICLVGFLIIMGIGITGWSHTAVTLHRLGYPDNIELEGSDPSFTFYLPVSSDIDLNKSFLQLHLTASSVLDTRSSLKVLIDDRPQFTSAIRDISRIGQNATVKVPLSGVKTKSFSDALKVEIIGHLFITRNICEDLATGNLWLTIHNDSFASLSIKKAEYPLTIATFLDGFFQEIHLIFPKELSRESSTVYVKLFTFLQRYFRDRGVLLKIFPFGQGPLNKDNLQVRRIYVEGSGDDLYLDSQGQLHISSGGIDAFISSWRDLLLVPAVTIGIVEEAPTSGANLTLAKLGYGPLAVSGIGDLTVSYYFTASDLGGFPRSMRLVLYGRYTPIQPDTKTQSFIKVHLNGLLIKALPLSQNGTINGLAMDIPAHTVSRENTLDVTYAYYPEVGNCLAGTSPFEGWIDNQSYLEVSGYRKDEYLGFQSLPTSLLGKGLIVLPSQKDPGYCDYLQAAAYLLASFRQMDREPVNVEIAHPEDIKDKTADYYLFAISAAEMDQFEPIVKTKTEQITLYNPLTYREVFSADLNDQLGILQVFSYKKRPAVSIGSYWREEWDTYIDTADVPIFGLDAGGRINYWNSKVTEITDYGKDEIMGHNLLEELINEQYQGLVKEQLEKIQMDEEEARYELPLLTKDGQQGTLLLRVNSHRDPSQTFIYKFVEIAIYGKNRTMNDSLIKEVIRKNYQDLVSRMLRAAMLDENSAGDESELYLRDDQPLIARFNLAIRQDACGNIMGIVGPQQDITRIETMTNKLFPILQLAYELRSLDSMRRLRGNVAFFKDGNLVSFDVGKQLRIRTSERSTWYYYQRYRTLIFLVLLALLAVGAWLIYHRLARVKQVRKQL
ncbi:hypothetical protein CEE34_08810 [Candidatus Aerophobetes bacterium Ae_b3a]|nr:MAG: hypothetical protein CEE34_08810 [Candidatus Aerophobetes bacterium Ae_b3a]